MNIIDDKFRDIISIILSHLDVISLRNIIIVCKHFNNITNIYITIKKIQLKIPIYKEFGDKIIFKIYDCSDLEAEFEIRKYKSNNYRYILYKPLISKPLIDHIPMNEEDEAYLKIYKNNKIETYKLYINRYDGLYYLSVDGYPDIYHESSNINNSLYCIIHTIVLLLK